MASLYLPLIGIFMEILLQLCDPSLETKVHKAYMEDGNCTELGAINQNIAIASSSLYGQSSSDEVLYELAHKVLNIILLVFYTLYRQVISPAIS